MIRHYLLVVSLSCFTSSCHDLIPSYHDEIVFSPSTSKYFALGSVGVVEFYDNCVRDILENCDSDRLTGVSAQFSDPSVFEIISVNNGSVTFNVLSEGTSTLTISGDIGNAPKEGSMVLEARSIDDIELRGPACHALGSDFATRGAYAFAPPTEIVFQALIHGGGEPLGGRLELDMDFELPEGVTMDGTRKFVVSSDTAPGSSIRVRENVGGDELNFEIVTKPVITAIDVRWATDLDGINVDSVDPFLGASFEFDHRVCNEENIEFTVFAGPPDVCGFTGDDESMRVTKTLHTAPVRLRGAGTCEVAVEVDSGGDTLRAEDSFQIQ